jgi:sorting nexin-27
LDASGESSGRIISGKINNLSKNDGQEVELCVALPDKAICSLNIKTNATTDDVYAALAEKLQLDAHISGFFYLFEVIDNTFGKI